MIRFIDVVGTTTKFYNGINVYRLSHERFAGVVIRFYMFHNMYLIRLTYCKKFNEFRFRKQVQDVRLDPETGLKRV